MRLATPVQSARAAGLAFAVLLTAGVDRAVASVVQGAPPRSLHAWSAALGVHAALVLIAALAMGITALLARRLAPPSRAAPILGALATALALWPLAIVGREVTLGPWISEKAWAPVLQHGLALGGAALFGLLAWATAHHPAGRGRAARAITYGALALGTAAAWADVAIAPGRFVLAHRVAIGASTLALTVGALRLFAPAAASDQRPAVGRRLLAISAPILVVLGAGAWLNVTPALRAELLLHAPVSATVLRAMGGDARLKALLSSPAPSPDRDPPITAASAPRLPLPSEVSVLFITVDALRADALPPVRDGDEHPVAPGDTPVLDALVARSTAFTHAYAQASMTLASMPVLFRSLHTFESPDRLGRPLARTMADLDRRPLAVVNDWFLEEKAPRIGAMLDGFERVQVYAPEQTNELVPMALDLVDDVAPEPFFLWVHVFALHAPGYAGRPLGPADGPWPARYRRSVTWLDGQIGELLSGLQERGLGDTTIVVLASDHGEGLGDNGVARHGATVFEEEVRVPLVVHVPGRPAGIVDRTVGNIDLVPTFVELLGGLPDPTHRGRSLVGLVAEPESGWERAYYTRNRTGESVALVVGRDKIVWDVPARAAMRFDLATDPREDTNVFAGTPDDERLLERLFRLDPGLLADELGDPDTRALLIERLRAIHAGTPDAELDLLFELGRRDEGEDVPAIAAERFAAIDDRRVRLRLCAYFFTDDPKAWGKRLVRWLKGSDEADALAGALADQGQPAFAPRWVAGQLRARVQAGPDAVLPWLRLVASWRRLSRAAFAEPLAEVLRRAGDGGSRQVASAALRAARHVRGLARDEPGTLALAAAIDRFVDHPDASLQVEAVRALARRGAAASDRLRGVVRETERPVHVRQAALRAVARQQGADAIALVEEAGADPRLLVDAVNLLRDTKDPAAIEALQRLGQQPMDAKTKRRVKKAIAELRRRRP